MTRIRDGLILLEQRGLPKRQTETRHTTRVSSADLEAHFLLCRALFSLFANHTVSSLPNSCHPWFRVSSGWRPFRRDSPRKEKQA